MSSLAYSEYKKIPALINAGILSLLRATVIHA